MKSFLILLKPINDWLKSAAPQGIGSLLLGVAALIGLWQTGSVLTTVLEIQNQAKEIRNAVNVLEDQMKQQKAESIVNNSEILKTENTNEEDIISEIKKIPSEMSSRKSGIYLPKDKYLNTIEELKKERSPEARKEILKNNLEYQNINN